MVRPWKSARQSLWSRYRLVLSDSAWRFFFPAAAGRVGIAMTGLALLWVVEATTGSFATAGAVTGCFALAEAVAGPQVARLFDRYGQRCPLVLLVVVHAAAVTGILGAAHAGGATPALCVLAAGAGASLPQLGACSAARWTRVHTGPLLRTAFALEAMANDVAFLLGPSIVVTVAVAWSPLTGVALATGLVVSGGVLLAAVRERRDSSDQAVPTSRRASVPEPSNRALLGVPLVSIVVVNLGLGGIFGSMQLAVTASAAAAERPGLAGALYSLLALGGLVGGFVFGARTWRSSPSRQLLTASFCLLAVVASMTAAPTLGWLAAAVLTAGLLIAPVMVLSGTMVARLVRPAIITQALSWTSSASAAGLAAAAATAGYVIDRHGPQAGVSATVAAASVLLLAATAAAANTRRAR